MRERAGEGGREGGEKGRARRMEMETGKLVDQQVATVWMSFCLILSLGEQALIAPVLASIDVGRLDTSYIIGRHERIERTNSNVSNIII